MSKPPFPAMSCSFSFPMIVFIDGGWFLRISLEQRNGRFGRPLWESVGEGICIAFKKTGWGLSLLIL